MITIIDYGAGNLKSLQNAFRYLGISCEIVNSASALATAKKVILPGVGAFSFAMQNLRKLELIDSLLAFARGGGPLLGICLGMQVFMSESEEGGRFAGLDLIEGKVERFSGDLKVPHIGWNQLHVTNGSPLLRDLPDSDYAYFVHSYVCRPKDDNVVVGTCDYGSLFCASVQKDNIYGVQFHPEKSQEFGLKILQNFAGL